MMRGVSLMLGQLPVTIFERKFEQADDPPNSFRIRSFPSIAEMTIWFRLSAFARQPNASGN